MACISSTSVSSASRYCRKYQQFRLFGTASREWTRISVDGPAPAGRIGHSVVMIGPRIYIFGGEADGEYSNDLWCFDLSTREFLHVAARTGLLD